ncbi:MAG TPA: hypothetical protein VGH69_21425 [Mycobacterium sp.]
MTSSTVKSGRARTNRAVWRSTRPCGDVGGRHPYLRGLTADVS